MCVNFSPKHGSTLNTRSNVFMHSCIEYVTSCVHKITLRVAVRGDGGVAGEGGVVDLPKFHSWGK